jgi:hypothetical protein
VRDDADGGGTGRSRSRPAWGAAAAALATGVFALALLAHAGPAAQRATATQRATAARAMPSAVVACERSGRPDCGPAARDHFPLDRPASPGARVLTLPQVVAKQGWTGDIVRARLMTYGQAAGAFPALAASAVVARSREVWVLTRYFAEPVTMPFAGGYGPPGEPATMTISAMSEVIDATTGQMTDECLGCAVIPRSG